MNFKDVKEFIDLAREEGVAELKYETKDLKIQVSFAQKANTSIIHTQTPTVSHSSEAAEAIFEGHTIKSPFVGTFYASPSPDKPAFVRVGDVVKKGQTLCILEAMKIMNEIESDVDGTIVEICVENESLVEYGQEIFRIKK